MDARSKLCTQTSGQDCWVGELSEERAFVQHLGSRQAGRQARILRGSFIILVTNCISFPTPSVFFSVEGTAKKVLLFFFFSLFRSALSCPARNASREFSTSRSDGEDGQYEVNEMSRVRGERSPRQPTHPAQLSQTARFALVLLCRERIRRRIAKHYPKGFKLECRVFGRSIIYNILRQLLISVTGKNEKAERKPAHRKAAGCVSQMQSAQGMVDGCP